MHPLTLPHRPRGGGYDPRHGLDRHVVYPELDDAAEDVGPHAGEVDLDAFLLEAEQ